jgi:ABC-type multidrug transport system ATPase subunit
MGMLASLGLTNPEILSSPVDALSAGEPQKIAILLMLSTDAAFYLIDEPLSNLDVDSRPVIINLILKKTKEKTLIVIMHGFEEYYHHFDRLIKIEPHRDIESNFVKT